MNLRRTMLIALLASGCATADRVQTLEDRVAELEGKVEELASRPAAAKSATAEVDPAAEEAAQKLYAEVTELVKAGKLNEAKAKVEILTNKYAATKTARRANKVAAELEVIGKPAPTALAIDKWFQGEDEVNIANPGPTLVVFWEEWCPHCKREVPNLNETYGKFKGQGLQVVGLTKITRKSTEESVTTFIEEKEVAYPMAKETGDMSSYFNVSGIPAAAVVKDGSIVWRGHPARLTDEMIQGWL
ncbi:MAG: TlpA disulfide reductase family protein [Myxococcota bacterium]|nr:TlpA disulfide reductase family protein [Myxococcota bacterium]